MGTLVIYPCLSFIFASFQFSSGLLIFISIVQICSFNPNNADYKSNQLMSKFNQSYNHFCFK